MTRRKVPQMGWWMESYQKCSHTFVAKKRSELRGYCAKCGTDRSQVYHLPSPTPCGDEAEASAAITDDESEAHSMDTRERVARLLAECACMAYAWEDYLPRAAKICAIFAEEREAYWDDGEWNSSTARMKIKECAKQIVDLMHERDDWKTRAEKAEAREAALREALGKLRRSHDNVDGDCWYSCPKHEEYCGDQRRDLCTCGADKYNAIIDAALATVKEGKV